MPLIVKPPFSTLESGAVLYLPLWAGELSGGSFNSRDTNKHLCTVTGALWTPPGRTFDGNDDVIAIDPFTQADGLTTITVEAWAKHNVGGILDIASLVFKQEVLALAGGWTAHKAQFYPWFTTGQWTTGASTTSVDDGNWHHIVGVYDGSYLRLYVNGVQENSNNIGAKTLGTSAYPLGVGARKIGAVIDYEWAGTIGEVRIYSRALTALEVQRNYLSTRWRYV